MKKRNKSLYIMLPLSVMVCVLLSVVFARPLDSAEEPASYAPKNIEAEDFIDYTKEPEKEGEETVEPETEAEINETEEFEMIPPVEGNIIIPFSDNQLIFSKTMNDYRIHTGIDIKAPVLSRVYAVEDGITAEVKDDSLMGKTIIIDHENGFKSIYKNLSSAEMVNIGDSVKKGSVISGVGESAITEIKEESHLHFELEKDGIKVNPEDYIKF